MHKLLRYALILTLMASVSANITWATTLIPKNLNELTNEAEMIFTGRVIDIRSEWSPDHTTIYTFVTFAPTEILKGQIGSAVELRFEGGTVDDTTIEVGEVPTFERDQQVLLFAHGNGQAICPLVGWSQGYFRIETDDQGRETILDAAGRPILGVRNGELLKAEEPIQLKADVGAFGGITETGQVSQPAKINPRRGLRQAMTAMDFLVNVRQIADEINRNPMKLQQDQKSVPPMTAPRQGNEKPAAPPDGELSATRAASFTESGPLSLMAGLPLGLGALAFFRSRSRGRNRRSGLQKLIGLCLIIGCGASVAFPYSYRTSGGNKVVWEDARMTFDLHPVSFPEGSTWNLNAQYAMSDWNAVTGSAFRFYVRTRSTNHNDHNNGINSVVFMNGSSFDSSSILAVTFHTASGDEIRDKDVWFNVDQPYVPGLDADAVPPYSTFSFRGVARHEFGHALGLRHEDRSVVTTMNSIYSYGAAVEGFHADDRAGVRFLYPGSGSERNLYASNWVKRTDSESTAAVRVNTLPTRIRRGQSVTLEYSFGNRGNLNSGSFEIGFYLSSNNIISTGDRLLGFNTGAFANAGAFGSFTRTLTIPADVTPGTYFIGVFMDRTGIITESSEGDNGLAHYQSIIVDP